MRKDSSSPLRRIFESGLRKGALIKKTQAQMNTISERAIQRVESVSIMAELEVSGKRIKAESLYTITQKHKMGNDLDKGRSIS
jgi:hypothetical protein